MLKDIKIGLGSREYQNLSQLERLNVNADRKAGEFQDAYGATRPIVLLMPRTKAHLLGPEGTITGHYPEYLRYAAAAPALKEYIQRKNNWEERTMKLVNWKAHCLALKKQNKRRTHFTKMIFDILPTMKQLNKFDNGSRKCPSCQTLHEDCDHILWCLASRRVPWRFDFMESLTKFCRKTQTDPDIQTPLRVGWEQWFSTYDGDIQLYQNDFAPKLHGIIEQQNRIGWRQLFNGRFGTEWSAVQQAAYNRYQQRNESTIKRIGERWQTQLIQLFWTKWEKAWEDRNQQALHGHTMLTRNEAIRREVRRQIETIYQHRHLMEPSAQDLLYDQPEDHDRQQLTTTRNWLAQHATIFKESIRRAKARALRNVRSIRTYFQSASGG